MTETNTTQTDSTATQNTQNDAQTTQTQTEVNTTPAKNENTEVNIEKLIQKAVDRATNKLGNDNKKLREQLEALKGEKLTAEERRQLELADKEADIADREAKLQEKENRLFAIKAIKDAGLDDGSSNALELVDFVMGTSEEVTTARVKTFSELVKKFVSAEVNRTFKEHGRNPETSGAGGSETKNNIAATIGKINADRNAASQKVRDYYLGGKN